MGSAIHNPKTLQARIVSGSIVLLSGSGVTTVLNLAYNVAIAHFLGPIGYGHATVVYTLLTLISAVTLSFQILSAKVIAQQQSPELKAAVYRSFLRAAWSCGVAASVALFFFQEAIAQYLNLPSPVLVALLAVGAAFYVPLGSKRGYIQGIYGFRGLAVSLVLEGAVRLGGSLLVVALGAGVEGVIAANTAAMMIAYFAIQPRLGARVPNPLRISYALRETLQVLVFFSGQVLINNCDIVLVKHFFPASIAGLYAAVAMVGRVIYASSSAVVNSMFPLVAGTRDETRRDLKVIATSLLLVFGIGSVLSLALFIAPPVVWSAFLGSAFELAGNHNLSHLLAFYAVTTVVYSLSVVIITFEMSYKIANASYVQLAFGGVLIAAICRFHSSVAQVIMVQFILMSALFVLVAVPFLITSLTRTKNLSPTEAYLPVRLLRPVAENEVIAEFLKSDFHCPEFNDYRESLGDIVVNPNLQNPEENGKRRALLFIRHLALWKEIPADTEWYEVELNALNFAQVRFFPRAQWRKLGRGNFSITEILEGMRSRRQTVDAPFLEKIAAIRRRLNEDDAGCGAVVLIGVSETELLTVVDGNHRLVSAMLESPNRLPKLKFLCGLSPRMTECCWYNTNLATLLRYGRNVLSHVVRDPEAELVRLLEGAG